MGRMKQIEAYIRSGGDDAIAAVSELLPRWISVEERLPETPSGEWEIHGVCVLLKAREVK
jgi:hypothetical protein